MLRSRFSYFASGIILRDLRYSDTGIIFSLLKHNYEALITNMIKNGQVVDHSQSPCEKDFIPDVQVI